ncbi:MAG: choice-of-anchor V domain-containing protein [Bacteroidota bacterium]
MKNLKMFGLLSTTLGSVIGKVKASAFGKTIVVIGILVLCMSFIGILTPNPPPSGKSGGPSNGGATCYDCHSDAPVNSGSAHAVITTNFPAGGYVAGQTYNITATVGGTAGGMWQFELSAQSPTGTFLGTLHNASTTQLFSSSHYIAGTLTSTNNTGGQTWNFTWTAPASGLGPLTFYGAFLEADGDGTTSGDNVYTATYPTHEAVTGIATANATPEINVYPNPNSGNFSFDINAVNAENASLQIMNITGQVVYNETIQLNAGQNIKQIALGQNAPGLYLVRVTTSAGEKMMRFMVN